MSNFSLGCYTRLVEIAKAVYYDFGFPWTNSEEDFEELYLDVFYNKFVPHAPAYDKSYK